MPCDRVSSPSFRVVTSLRQAARPWAALLAVGLAASLSSAQVTFERTYGGVDPDFGCSVQPTADGGYVVAGATKSFGPGGSNVYLVRTDSLGDTVWTRTYGGDTNDYGASVQPTSDGGFMVGGWTRSFGAGGFDAYLVKTDADGDTQWTRTYGGAENDDCQLVQQTADSGYILAGVTASSGADSQDIYLVKTSASGDTQWTRMYGGPRNEYGYSVQQTRDAGYIVTGTTTSFGAGDLDVYLIKTDASGDTVWTRTFGGAAPDDGHSVRQTADGGYIVAGCTESFGAGGRDVYLIKTDSTGAGQWVQVYGDTSDGKALSICQTADSGFIIAGSARLPGQWGYDVYIIKTDAIGDTQWTRTYGGAVHDYGSSIQLTSDGGYVIAGQTLSYGRGLGDVYLIKTDSLGRVIAVAEPKAGPLVAAVFGPTIVRGVMFLPEASSHKPQAASLHDISGRRVLDLKPGANDVRSLAPGVYFVKEAHAQAHAVQKVVLAR